MIVPTIHARERIQLRVDATLTDEEAWALLWDLAHAMPDGTVFWCGEIHGKTVNLPVRDGTIATVMAPGEMDDAPELVAAQAA